MKPIFYRHYDMRDRVEQSRRHSSFWIITPMTTVSPVATAIMNDFGDLVKIDFVALAASVSNGCH